MSILPTAEQEILDLNDISILHRIIGILTTTNINGRKLAYIMRLEAIAENTEKKNSGFILNDHTKSLIEDEIRRLQ